MAATKANLDGWEDKGFGKDPAVRIAPKGGIPMYRCWGGTSTEWGSGYFSAEKPYSVVEAELRFNIIDWYNTIHFITSFRLKEGFRYFIGPVAHGARDICMPAMQIFVEPNIGYKGRNYRS